MHARFMLLAAAAASLTATAGAEPPKSVPQQAGQPANRPAEILLASADIRAPGPQADAQAPVPAKRPRAARVTSCRCAGQVTQP